MAPKAAPAKAAPKGPLGPATCCPPFIYYPLLGLAVVVILSSGLVVCLQYLKVIESVTPIKEPLTKLRKALVEWGADKESESSSVLTIQYLLSYEELMAEQLSSLDMARIKYAVAFAVKPKFRFWELHGKYYYYISRRKKNWYDAERFCRARDSHLASIISFEEQNFITSQVAITGAWIGLTKSNAFGSWEWTDNSGFTTLYWSNEKPESEQKEGMQQDCVTIVPSHNVYTNWKPANCYTLNYWVCKSSHDLSQS